MCKELNSPQTAFLYETKKKKINELMIVFDIGQKQNQVI